MHVSDPQRQEIQTAPGSGHPPLLGVVGRVACFSVSMFSKWLTNPENVVCLMQVFKCYFINMYFIFLWKADKERTRTPTGSPSRIWSPEFSLGLSHGWHGPNHLRHNLLPLGMNEHEAGRVKRAWSQPQALQRRMETHKHWPNYCTNAHPRRVSSQANN